MQERSIQLSAGPFRYLERPGEGPPLVFLHGLGDSADQFLPVAERLPVHWRLLALDQRGHGGSCRPNEGYSPLDFAGDLKAFLEALEISPAHLFGHSMGGRNALVLAAQEPARARTLILGDIGPDENQQDIKATREFFEGLPESFATPAEARAHWQDRRPGYTEENLDLLMSNLESAPDGTLHWRYSVAACIAAVTAARSRGWWDFLGRIRCPVLLLHAEESPELSGEVARRMQRQLPHLDYARIRDCGHNFHLENPEQAASEIIRFVNQNEPSR